MYWERASRLPGAVVWHRVSATGGAQRILPDGCVDLIWDDGTLLVAGPDTGPHFSVGQPGARYAGLRFAPGAGPKLLGVPADELRDRRVPLADIWPQGHVRRLTERVAEAPDPGVFLEALALERTFAPDPAVAGIVAQLRAGATVAATADAAGLSERQLHRRCLVAFGYGPKTLARILRMDRAVALARAGMPYAAVAATAGYADQAHLAREVRDLTGTPLTTLIR